MNKDRTFIIAEAGGNHNGSIDLARQLIDVAVVAKADAVKFQTWKTDKLLTKEVPLAPYQEVGDYKSQFEMLKALELSYDDFRELKAYCDSQGILFLSTPDESESARFLNKIQPLFKVGSGDLTNIPFIQQIAGFGKPLIISSGMGTLVEVGDALKAATSTGLSLEDIVVLHANTEYPSPIRDVNLKAMLSIRDQFNVGVGYSDHTHGFEIAIAAVAMGACVIEKHFTLDKNLPGPDHKASLDPQELSQMTRLIRNVEIALGDGVKRASNSEKKNREVVRKSIVAATSIKAGERFSAENLSVKRPGIGLSPASWDRLIGYRAKRSYTENELIDGGEIFNE